MCHLSATWHLRQRLLLVMCQFIKKNNYIINKLNTHYPIIKITQLIN